jgi:hypothetical protein
MSLDAVASFESEKVGLSGLLENPRGIAVDRDGKRLYVAGAEASWLGVLSPGGSFLRRFSGGASSEVDPFKGPRGVALDRAGDLYVVEEENHRVEKLAPTGRLLWMIGGQVNRSSGANLCTAASGDRCGPGLQGTEVGAFRDWDAGNFIAVGPSGTVYVGDKGRIQEFSPSGRFLSAMQVPKQENVGSVAVDSRTGDIYWAYSQFWTDDPHVFKVDPSGREICSARVPGSSSLATAGDGRIFVVSDPASSGAPRFEPVVVEMSSGCQILSRFGRRPEGTSLNSLAVSPAGKLYVGTYVPGNRESYLSIYDVGTPSGDRWWTWPFRWLFSALRWLAEPAA